MKDKSLKTAKVYDKVAEKYSEKFDKDFSDNLFVEEFISLLPKKAKLLELGCGTGKLAKYFFKKGFNIIGIDLSKKMIEIAKRKNPEIKFIKEDMRKIKFPNKSFDAIILAYSLFHMEKKDALKLIKKIEKILKEKGFIFLILQEGEKELWVTEDFLPEEKIFLKLYSEKEIISMLKNFEIISVKRKKPQKIKGELPYNKLIIIAKKK